MFFDTPNVEASKSFDTLPEGTYRLQITNSELKPTKTGTGEILSVTLEVIQGQHKGQKLWATYNLVNQSEKAQQIGKAQFKSLLKAIGVTEPLQTFDEAGRKLQNKTLWGEVEHETFNGKTYAKLKKPVDAPQASNPQPVTSIDPDMPF